MLALDRAPGLELQLGLGLPRMIVRLMFGQSGANHVRIFLFVGMRWATTGQLVPSALNHLVGALMAAID
jgi:hypothetical protein